MNYVGMRNSWIKRALIKSAGFRVVKKKTDSLAYDCRRHIELLANVEKRAGLSDSLYMSVNRFYSDRNPDFMAKKIERFLGLYEKMKKEKGDNLPIIVTINGARLDGSHRVSILKSLGVEEVEVREVYAPKILVWLAGREARKRRQVYEKFAGNKIYSRDKKRFIGRVLYTDYVRRDPLCLTGSHYHILDTGEIVDAKRCYLEE